MAKMVSLQYTKWPQELKIENFLKAIFSYTPGPISLKVYRDVSYVTLYQNDFAPINNMAENRKKVNYLLHILSPPKPFGLCDTNFFGMLPRWLPT